MLNQISFERIKETIYALSALNMKLKDPRLPGPLGLQDSDALDALGRDAFVGLCVELGKPVQGVDSVELGGDYRAALEEVVTDRVLAQLTHRSARPELLKRLKARMRVIPGV